MAKMENDESTMKVTYLLLPYMREILTDYLHELADEECRKKSWVYNGNPDFYYCLKHSFDFLEDRTYYDYPTTNQIGYSLYNKKEAQLIDSVAQNFLALFEQLGWDRQPEEKYLNSPYWSRLINSAKKAYPIFQKNDEKYEPLIRQHIIEHLHLLSDNQLKMKFKKKNAPSFWTFFVKVYKHLKIFMNNVQARQIKSYWIIKTDEEVKALNNLREAFYEFLKDIGLGIIIENSWKSIEDFPDQTNEVYLKLFSLDKVIITAREAYQIFIKNDI